MSDKLTDNAKRLVAAMFPEMLQTVIVGLMIVIPVILIYKKAGFNPMWAGLVFVPVFGLLLIFMQLAFQAWPNAERRYLER